MTGRMLPIIFALLSSAGALPADADTQQGTQSSRLSLERQRAHYRQTVSQYGVQSAQAREAKKNLRVARRQYFTQRRRTAHPPTRPTAR